MTTQTDNTQISSTRPAVEDQDTPTTGRDRRTLQRYATELHRIETAGRYTADMFGNWLPELKAEYRRLLQLWNQDNHRQFIEGN